MVLIKAVVFDLDGTLASFNLDYQTIKTEVRGYLLKMGVPALVLSVSLSVFGMLRRTEVYFKFTGKPAKVLKEVRMEALAIAEKYELEAAMCTSLLPGAVETLKALRLMNLKIGLFTINSDKSVNCILHRFKIGDFFDVTVPRNRVKHVKPHREHLEAVLKALGSPSESTVVVGDSSADMCCARKLKAIAVGFDAGISARMQLTSKGANYVITSLTDLPVLVDRINRMQRSLKGVGAIDSKNHEKQTFLPTQTTKPLRSHTY